VIGAAGAQAYQLLLPPGFMNTGLFTLGAGEVALYNVTVDDNRDAAPTTVLIQLIDPAGTLIARQAVTLGPGQSTTMRWAKPGTYRFHAEFTTPATTLSLRRRLITSLEILGDPLGGLSIPRVYVCSSSDQGSGNGRLPD
jgi:hypothetical protein